MGGEQQGLTWEGLQWGPFESFASDVVRQLTSKPAKPSKIPKSPPNSDDTGRPRWRPAPWFGWASWSLMDREPRCVPCVYRVRPTPDSRGVYQRSCRVNWAAKPETPALQNDHKPPIGMRLRMTDFLSWPQAR